MLVDIACTPSYTPSCGGEQMWSCPSRHNWRAIRPCATIQWQHYLANVASPESNHTRQCRGQCSCAPSSTFWVCRPAEFRCVNPWIWRPIQPQKEIQATIGRTNKPQSPPFHSDLACSNAKISAVFSLSNVQLKLYLNANHITVRQRGHKI